MYNEIEKYAVDFDNLRRLLLDPQSDPSIVAIRGALETTALRLANTEAASETGRRELAKLYRGFLAASRVVAHLQERQATRK